MKTLFSLLSFLALCSLSFAQQRVNFSYDAAGNRIGRTVITMSRAMHAVSDSLEQEKVSNTLYACKVTVYPNPTEGEVNLSVSNGREDAVSAVVVYDVSGNLLKTLQIQGNTSVSIDLSDYPEGIYLIDFRQEESASYYKIIKK